MFVLYFITIFTPCMFWRMVIGPVTGISFWIYWFMASTAIFFFVFLVAEYFLVKYLSIVIFGRILPIMDDFFALFVQVSNAIVAAVFGLINCYTFESNEIEMRLAGLPTTMAQADKLHLG